jgi:tetratricopeptide (TPR) repeat protein
LDENAETHLLCQKHAQHYLAVAESGASLMYTAQEPRRFSQLETEHDNLRAALRWSLTQDDAEQMSLRFIAALARYWGMRGHYSEGQSWLAESSKLPSSHTPTKVRAHALLGMSELSYDQCDYLATETLAAEALTIYRELGHRWGTAMTLLTLGNVATEVGNYDLAPLLFQEAYDITQELGDVRVSVRALLLLSWGAMRPGNYPQARTWLEQALTLCLQNNSKTGIAFASSGLGEVALRQGNLDEAVHFLEQSLALRRELGEKWGIAASLGSLGWVALLQRDYEQTAALLLESFTMRNDHHDSGGMAWCLEKFAEMSYLQGDPARATQLYGAAAALRATVNSVIDPADQPHYDAIIAEIRAEIGHQRFDTLWSQGQSLTLDQITVLLS